MKKSKRDGSGILNPKAQKLVRIAKKLFTTGHSFGYGFKEYAKELFKKWPERRSYGSLNEFFLKRWAEMGRDYAEKATKGSGLIYELYESRRCNSILNIINGSRWIGTPYIRALMNVCEVDWDYLHQQIDRPDSGWECMKCYTPLSIGQLAYSMSFAHDPLCNTCLIEEVC